MVRSAYEFNKFQKQIFQEAGKYLPNDTSNKQENFSVRQQRCENLELPRIALYKASSLNWF